jgi:hypothetical protein
MQGSGPLASGLGGVLTPLLGLMATMGLSAVLVGSPGLLGLMVEGLRQAGGEVRQVSAAGTSTG